MEEMYSRSSRDQKQMFKLSMPKMKPDFKTFETRSKTTVRHRAALLSNLATSVTQGDKDGM